ncbi:hypothetical protein B484DRAFT_392601 [Ochromonadaceae sp. CCMP2298]|nr:hypothetical protein B484DRAFT_392601 [Ochromonadaceae sp. CCMP2298]
MRGVSERLLLDARWSFLSGLQSSYVGQLFAFLEQVAELNATCLGVQEARFGRKGRQWGAVASARSASSSGSASAWEGGLRTGDLLAGLWSCEQQGACRRAVPVLVRAHAHTHAHSHTGSAEKEWDGEVDGQGEEGDQQRNGERDGGDGGEEGEEGGYGEGGRLFAWLHVASLHPGLVSEWSLFSVFVEEACAQVGTMYYIMYDV